MTKGDIRIQMSGLVYIPDSPSPGYLLTVDTINEKNKWIESTALIEEDEYAKMTPHDFINTIQKLLTAICKKK